MHICAIPKSRHMTNSDQNTYNTLSNGINQFKYVLILFFIIYQNGDKMYKNLKIKTLWKDSKHEVFYGMYMIKFQSMKLIICFWCNSIHLTRANFILDDTRNNMLNIIHKKYKLTVFFSGNPQLTAIKICAM